MLLPTNVPPAIESGRLRVPLRSIFEALGAVVNYSAAEETIHVTKGFLRIEAGLGSPVVRVNGMEFILDVPAKAKNGRTLVPFRFFSDILGCAVEWSEPEMTARVTSNPGRRIPVTVTGYYAFYSYQSFRERCALLSDASVSWFELRPDGMVAADYPQGYKATLDFACAAGVQPFAPVFHDNRDGAMSELLLDSERRDKAITSIRQLAGEDGYAGINLDIEGLAAADREHFNTFVAELAEQLHADGFLLTLPLPAKAGDVSWRRGYDYATLGQLADTIVLMTYDEHYAGGVPGPVASMGWTKAVVE